MRVRALLCGWAVVALACGAGPAAADAGWVWPLAGPHVVSRGFHPPATRYGPGHRGADLPGRLGQEVLAAGAGRISYAGLLAGRGVVVVVHGDLRTTYEPVAAAVRVGQLVAAGAVIGHLTAGHAGCPGACLHWGLLRGEVYLDPVRLVRAGPSRLLPLDRPLQSQLQTGFPAASRTRGAPPAARAVPAAAGTPPPGLRPAAEPAFALRAADLAWGGGAVAALLAGLLLLRPRRRPPDGPAAPAALLTQRVVAEGLVDLTSERERRRAPAAS